MPAISADINQDNAFIVENSTGYNCAEVAAWCNNTETIHIIMEASKMADIPSYYWHGALRMAACEGLLDALTTILVTVGDNFVVSFPQIAYLLSGCFPTSLTSGGKLK